LFTKEEYKKGETIVSNKGICATCYFVLEGYVRSFVSDNDAEKTLWFGEKGDLLTAYQTLFKNVQGKETVVALTNCTLLSISMKNFKELIQNEIDFSHFYIKIIEEGYHFWENRYLILCQLNVEKRYNEWLSRTKHLAPYIPLGVLAQYLNIDQATLSRIRGKIKTSV
jgi:CRP-like cAMP-binding protein